MVNIHKTPTQLTTDRLLIRPFTPEDIDAFFALLSDPGDKHLPPLVPLTDKSGSGAVP